MNTKEYTTFASGNRPPSMKEFLLNIEEKENDVDFTGDMEALLRPEIKYNQNKAFDGLKPSPKNWDRQCEGGEYLEPSSPSRMTLSGRHKRIWLKMKYLTNF